MKTSATAQGDVGERSAPRDFEALRQAITDRFPKLSKRLQDIAGFALDQPNDMAIETVAVIARRAGVPPSALIRFANTFGYSGFSEMQRVFQSALLERVPSYSERMRQAMAQDGDRPAKGAIDILQEFCTGNIVSLRHLGEIVPAAHLEQALDMLGAAKVIHLLGMRRSFPVAAYLAYVLSHAERRTHLLTGEAGLLPEQSRLMTPDDVLVTVSATPYAQETVSAVESAARRRIPIIAITDSQVSPIARSATLAFCIHDAELRGFRALTASMCLAQTLAVGLALRAVRQG